MYSLKYLAICHEIILSFPVRISLHVTVTSTLTTAAPIRKTFKCHCRIPVHRSAEFDELK